LGTAIKPGYNSHYVRTSRFGKVATAETDTTFDEIVVPQEAQIVPAFIFSFDSNNFTKLISQFSDYKEIV